MIVPIWKDTYVEISSTEQITEYYITIQYFRQEETLIYNGRAFGYRRTGTTYNYVAEIYLNPIVKDYLNTKVDIPKSSVPFDKSQAIVRVYNSMNDTIIGEEYVFVDDYSYEDIGYEYGILCLNRPIKNNVANVPLPVSFYDYTNDPNEIIYCKCKLRDEEGKHIATYNELYSYFKYVCLFNGVLGKNNFYWIGEDGIEEFLIQYTIDDCKSNYAYYYKNALGGYDVLCVSGKMVQVDNLERKTIEVYKDGKQNFENVITRTYSTFTGFLTEEQSLLMHHLLNSTEVYLYDIQEGTYVPVVLTNTTTEYKTKQNQNKKMISYNITCEEATKKYRR